MLHAAELALIFGFLTAGLGRLPQPYISSVWCAIGSSSLGLWVVAVSQSSRLTGGLALGLGLQFAYALTLVCAASGFDHLWEAVAALRGRRA